MRVSTAGKPEVSRWHCYLLLAAAVMIYLLITMGGIVCVTGSGEGCPDWPWCYGRAVPPAQVAAVIEYLHRFVAVLALPFILGAAIVSWRKSRAIWWLSRPPVMAVLLVLAVSIFGAMAVLRGLPPGLAAVDLGSALLSLALMSISTVVAFTLQVNSSLSGRLSGRSTFARLTFWALGTMFFVLVSSVLVAGKGSLTRCLGWPMWQSVVVDLPGWPQTVRRLLAGVASVLVILVTVQAWRTQRQHKAIVSVTTAAGLLFLLEMTVGILMLAKSTTIFLSVIYMIAAGLLWVAMVVLATLAGLSSAAIPDNEG